MRENEYLIKRFHFFVFNLITKMFLLLGLSFYIKSMHIYREHTNVFGASLVFR